MGIRGFVVVLICAVVLGIVARSFDFSLPDDVRASGASGESTTAERGLSVHSSAGFTLTAIEVHDGERWRSSALDDGVWTPAGPGPWRVRAPGHAEVEVARGPVTLEPDALLVLRGTTDDLDAVETGFAERALDATRALAPFALAERQPDRWSWAVRCAPCLASAGLETLSFDVDVAGGRRLQLAWEPASGGRTAVDLDELGLERRTAPLDLLVVGPEGDPIAGARVALEPAGKAVRYRPRDTVLARNCVRIDAGPRPVAERATDASGHVRFEGVGLGQSLAVQGWDPATGRWRIETLEPADRGDEPIEVALTNAGVTVTGRFAFPAALADEPPTTADLQLVWRSSVEGVGTGPTARVNSAELRAHALEPDGSFRLVTTGPRTAGPSVGGEGRWELTLDALVPGCALASAKSVHALARDRANEVELEVLELEPAEPWILVSTLSSEREPRGTARVVALGDVDGPRHWVRLASTARGLELHPVPASEGEGYVARVGGRDEALPYPADAPARFVLRAEGHLDRWFQRQGDGRVEELDTTPVEIDVRIDAVPDEGHALALELGSARLALANLGPEWAGERFRARVSAPRGAALVAGDGSSARVALAGPRVELVLR